jgi:hypothetical protein
MIVSASYKTDIPAFYGEWFRRRLDAGYCKMRNPYGGQIYHVGLRPEDVDGFVFWTKNAGPFLDTLDEVRRRGYPFAVQYAINGYGRELEWAVVPAAKAAEHMKRIAGSFGQRAAVWRYDTIVTSSITDAGFHRANFERLARMLEGTADEVVVSFLQEYKKTRRNMDAAARLFKFTWHDPHAGEKRALLTDLSAIATSRGLALTVCTQPELLIEGVAGEARCIDAIRLSDIAGRLIGAKMRGVRPGCACYQSRDIGDYDTCPHGCVYCYAVTNRAAARQRYLRHNPDGEFLYTS